MTNFNKNSDNCNVYIGTLVVIFLITSIVFLFEIGNRYDDGYISGTEQGYERGYRKALSDSSEIIADQLNYFEQRKVFYDEYEPEENPL